MFWKIALGLGSFGLVLSVALGAIALRAFYGAGFQSDAEDIAFAGLLASALIFVVALVVTLVSLVFVLRGSKKAWEAENLK